jgi:hypothetical protein
MIEKNVVDDNRKYIKGSWNEMKPDIGRPRRIK